MKKNSIIIALLLLSMNLLGQGNSGLGFNYQAVVRGTDGFVLPKQRVDLRFSLMPGQQATQASWIETYSAVTDTYGTVGATIGKGKKAGGVAATFSDVNFAAVHYWLKVEIKEGNNYRELSYSALTSVPYAEVATNAISSPVGSIMPFAGNADKVPTGWLLCDGSEVSRSEYAALYDVISTAWGFGNNSTTFNLPDMRGMFLRGVSLESDKDSDKAIRVPLKEGGNSGNNVGSYQNDAIRNITGEFRSFDRGSAVANGVFSVKSRWSASVAGGNSDNWGTIIKFDASDHVDVGSDNRPQNIYVNYMIKY